MQHLCASSVLTRAWLSLGLQHVDLADAICSWEDGPGEEAQTALEGNSRVQSCGLGDGMWILGGRIPFTLLTPPPGRGHSRADHTQRLIRDPAGCCSPAHTRTHLTYCPSYLGLLAGSVGTSHVFPTNPHGVLLQGSASRSVAQP